MSLNWRLSRRDARQSRLEGLDGRGHNDSSRQLVPNPNSSREETVVEGIHIRPTDSAILQPHYCRQTGLSSLRRQSLEQSLCTSHISTIARHTRFSGSVLRLFSSGAPILTESPDTQSLHSVVDLAVAVLFRQQRKWSNISVKWWILKEKDLTSDGRFVKFW